MSPLTPSLSPSEGERVPFRAGEGLTADSLRFRGSGYMRFAVLLALGLAVGWHRPDAWAQAIIPARIDARMMRQPAVSATQIAFVYAGDIWVAPKSGGLAQRVFYVIAGGSLTLRYRFYFHTGDEKTAVRFRLDAEGKVVNVDQRPKSLLETFRSSWRNGADLDPKTGVSRNAARVRRD